MQSTVGAQNAKTWTRWTETLPVVRANLRKSVGIALAVGTAFVAMNQFGAILAGQATLGTWLRVLLTLLVLFCVSNYGILAASHRVRGVVDARPST